jgi:hypothetical protein
MGLSLGRSYRKQIMLILPKQPHRDRMKQRREQGAREARRARRARRVKARQIGPGDARRVGGIRRKPHLKPL